jgi:hypothetical protein
MRIALRNVEQDNEIMKTDKYSKQSQLDKQADELKFLKQEYKRIKKENDRHIKAMQSIKEYLRGQITQN